MNKIEFFDLLEQKLRGVPEPDRTHIMQRYEELFHRAMANGEPEEQIAYRLMYQGSGGYGNTSRGGDSTLRGLAAGFALALFNLIFVLGPFIAVVAVLFSLGVAGVVLLVSPFIYYLANGLPGSLNELLFVLFSGLTMFGLGLLFSVGAFYAVPRLFTLAGKYIRLNIKAVRGY